jgi:hypothetical protein
MQPISLGSARSACITALKVGFNVQEVKAFLRDNWPQFYTEITYGELSAWKREIERERKSGHA